MTFNFRSTATAAMAAAALLALSLPASALTVTYPAGQTNNPWGPYGHRGVHTNDPAYGGSAGTFSLHAAGLGGDFMAWCLDIEDHLHIPGDYDITTSPYNDNLLSSAQTSDLESLFGTSFKGLDMTDNNTSAAWQQALWEIVYEDSGSYDVTGGNFTATTNGAANALANSWLGNIGGTVTQSYKLTYLDSAGDKQDLVTVSEVPLPASALLLLGALSGLGLLGASRRRAA